MLDDLWVLLRGVIRAVLFSVAAFYVLPVVYLLVDVLAHWVFGLLGIKIPLMSGGTVGSGEELVLAAVIITFVLGIIFAANDFLESIKRVGFVVLCSFLTSALLAVIVGDILPWILGVIYVPIFYSIAAHEDFGGDIGDVFIRGRVLGTYRRAKRSIALLFPQKSQQTRRSKSKQVRGRRLRTFRETTSAYSQSASDREAGLLWGKLYLPPHVAVTGFLVAGTTGSGKTMTINMLMQSALRQMQPGSDTRAVIFDAKTEIIPQLLRMGIPEKDLIILHPFDKRCAAWDMGKDITGPGDFQEMASVLFPIAERAKDPFFDRAATSLCHGVLLSLHKLKPQQWTLRDVVIAMAEKDNLRAVLAAAPEHNAGRLERYFANDRTTNDVMATVENKIEPYQVIANYWHRAHRRFSLEDWVRGEKILIVGHSHRCTEALNATNQILYKRLIQFLLDQPNSSTRRSWLFFDELASAGKIPLFDQLLTKGRSKGACTVIGFQDIASLQHLYGEKLTDVFLNMVSNKAVLKLDGERTAKWAEGVFGYAEVKRTLGSRSVTDGRVTYGQSEQHVFTPIVMSSEFLALQKPIQKTDTGLMGFYSLSDMEPYKVTIPWVFLSKHLTTKGDDYKGMSFDERELAESESYLPPWTPHERSEMGLVRQPSSHNVEKGIEREQDDLNDLDYYQ